MRVRHWGVWVVCGLSLGCATPGRVASSPVFADLSVEALDARLGVVAPGPGGEWWALGVEPYKVSEASGIEAYRSTDEGRSWRPATELSQALNRARAGNHSNVIDFLTWYTPEVGLVAGHLGPRIFRTTDAGKTWHSVPLVDKQWIYTLARSGPRTWMCGSSGRIVRSDDQGASWQELTATPFNDRDRCRGLSFVTPDQGWAVGTMATLWATEDGGNSWMPLAPPSQPPQRSDFGDHESPPKLHDVLRLTPELGWVQGSGGLYKTTDGGGTWQGPVSGTSSLHVSSLKDGRQVLTQTPPDLPVDQWVPSFEHAWGFLGDTVVALSDRSELTTFMGGQPLRQGPLLTRAQGRVTRLDGFIQRGSRHWVGWVNSQLMATHDSGHSWFRLGETAGRPIHSLVALGGGILLAELSSGQLLRSSDDGRTWSPGEGLEDYDFAVASGRKPGTRALAPGQRRAPPESPLACLLSTPHAVLQVEFDTHGCYGGTTNTWELRVRKEGAWLKGVRQRAFLEDAYRVDQRLDRAVGERFLRELVDAATRSEQGPPCQSTLGFEVRMAWSCGSGLFKTSRHARFTGGACLPWPVSDTGTPEPYARADGIFRAAEAVLEAAAPERQTAVPGAHPGATR
ncbi:WD40/YVTN/BNR-like repeat-containing protein [Corallococcus silvisoli]|uniref:WD40/YVTN/BNR-like repeat-containing protein n=1 Tax=Corallococcus silvisoli TaxID=2697031 RepID=UPI001378E6B7|nr:hypothetical protein [Corallococcus silvisoli]NBD10592.1 hypothetical protein [Corallococcus silvisoli]